MIQIASGVRYLHAHDGLNETPERLPIFHGDLKGDNIFISAPLPMPPSRITLKIGDMENHTVLSGFKTTRSGLKEKQGTYSHMSPEMRNFDPTKHEEGQSTDIGRASDMWSVGCIALELFGKGKLRYKTKDSGVVGLEKLSERDFLSAGMDDLCPDMQLMAGSEESFMAAINSCLLRAQSRLKADAFHETLLILQLRLDRGEDIVDPDCMNQTLSTLNLKA